MIQQLMSLERVETKTIDLAELAKTVADMERGRDLVAHGIWLRDPESGAIMIQDLSGNWRPDPKSPKVPRRISPQGVVVGPDDLHKMAALILVTTQMTERAGEEIKEALEPKRRGSQSGPTTV